jgi:hypothetical protein
VILIHDLERVTTRVAMRLSEQEWKSFHVSGSDTYLRQWFELATEYGLRISNPELEPAIEVKRERRSREREPGIVIPIRFLDAVPAAMWLRRTTAIWLK